MSYLLIHGDARKLPIDPKSIDAIVADPPYGINYFHRIGGKGFHSRRNSKRIVGDKALFVAAPWIIFPCVIWGANHYAVQIPNTGSWLTWDKSDGKEFGDSFVDGEYAWCSVRGIKRNVFRYLWKGVCCDKSEADESGGVVRVHPTQKPIALMRWCIQKLKLKPNSLICDPYCGSGSTAIAAIQEGHRFIGLDLDRRYLTVARHRLERPHARVPRPERADEIHPLFDRGGEHAPR